MQTKADRLASYYILELANQGRPEEQISQFIASMVVSGGMDVGQTLDFMKSVAERTIELLNNDNEIWRWLVPGGQMTDPLEDPLDKYKEALEDIQVALNKLDAADVVT